MKKIFILVLLFSVVSCSNTTEKKEKFNCILNDKLLEIKFKHEDSATSRFNIGVNIEYEGSESIALFDIRDPNSWKKSYILVLDTVTQNEFIHYIIKTEPIINSLEIIYEKIVEKNKSEYSLYGIWY